MGTVINVTISNNRYNSQSVIIKPNGDKINIDSLTREDIERVVDSLIKQLRVTDTI